MAAPPPPCTAEEVHGAMSKWLSTEILGDTASLMEGGLARFPTVCKYLQACYPDEAARQQFQQKVEQLEQQVARKWGAKADNRILRVPVVNEAREQAREEPMLEDEEGQEDVKQSVSRFRLRIWQLGFDDDAAFRGPSPVCDVLRCLERHLVTEQGNQTENTQLKSSST